MDGGVNFSRSRFLGPVFLAGTPLSALVARAHSPPTATDTNAALIDEAQAWDVSERAAALHASALVWDDHAGWGFNKAEDLQWLALWSAAGADFLSVNVGYDATPWTLAIEAVSQYRHWIREHSDRFVQVESFQDVQKAKRDNKLAVSFDLEGMGALNGDVGMVDFYYRLGVRQMLIAYNLNNRAGGGCHDDDTGLTLFGRSVIREMNRVGMLVDCSHTGYRTALEAMDASDAPVIFSHSNARNLQDHERNIPDDLIEACAATGGVIAINGVSLYLGPQDGTVSRLVDHIEYMAQLVGPEHVGIGLDSVPFQITDDAPVTDDTPADPKYWPARQYPASAGPDPFAQVVQPDAIPQITERLLDIGYDDSAILAIMGGNFARVAEQVWKPVNAG